MFIYKVGIGHNLLVGDLIAIVPQPRNGIVRSVRSYGDENHSKRSLHCIFEWNVLPGSTIYKSLMQQFGIYDIEYRDITILALDENLEGASYNATAIQPEFGEDAEWNNFFLRETSVHCHSLLRLGE